MSAGLEADFFGDEVFISRFPVHRACRDGDVGALVSLLQPLSNQAHLTAEDSSYGWTPIHWAAHYGQLECVARLVQMGCEVNAATSRFNQTPAHTAAFGGHPHCVVWLTQAGADVNRQDFVGEAPIHKAARSGSLECIQVLLIAGAKPHLRNASGQTAADLAHAHGFHDCYRFISKTQKHLLQLGGAQGANGAPCGQGLLSRKRLLTAVDTGHMKKPRSADSVSVQMQSSGVEEPESMNAESAQELHPVEYNKAVADRDDPEPPKGLASPPSLPASRQLAEGRAAPPARRPSADTCGSLHLTASPSSCVSHRPTWWGAAPPPGDDCGDFLHYGHYHGFGDTAEELGDGDCGGGQAERRYEQAAAGHLYRGS